MLILSEHQESKDLSSLLPVPLSYFLANSPPA